MSGGHSLFPDEVDFDALRAFTDRYGAVRLGPVVVVIAAYNEADTIGAVLDAVPGRSCGLEVDTVVVVDGATDDTAQVALHHGAYVCAAPTNRGQGAALRLGYFIARDAGADYIVTTDADGQYDVAGLPELLQPLLADEADFATGSRILGGQQTTDRVRRLGVHVFARLISAFTGQHVTDTSFGLRAMKAEVTAAVTLTQPQYQSSELLIGALTRGFRVVERPMTMRLRMAGHTKKGSNLFYGASYSRVVMGTWLRERRTGRVGRPPLTARQDAPARDPENQDPAAARER